MSEKKRPECRAKDCFANSGGHCTVLKDTDFKGRPCPFYKTYSQTAAEDARRRERLAAMGLPVREFRR